MADRMGSRKERPPGQGAPPPGGDPGPEGRTAPCGVPLPASRALPLLPPLLLLLLLAGCAGVGPQRLDADQMGYAAALGDGLKRQMLLNMVRLRYGDVPAFVTASQLISGYTLQSTGQAGLNAYPSAATGNFATFLGSVQYTTRPTFTFTPVTGERFALSYLRPLAPAELLSLAQSGAPIDLLFRVGVHSINGRRNHTTRGVVAEEATAEFQAITEALGQVQAVGALNIRFDRHPTVGRVHLVLHGRGRGAAEAAREAHRLLDAWPVGRPLEVIYSHGPRKPGEIAVLTRSVLHILHELGAGVEVTEAEVSRGETALDRTPSATSRRERLIVVRQGRDAPADAYAAVPYRDRWFWIDGGDYASKVAFSFAYTLQTLAESAHGQPTPIVTIPAQ
jgi:hypothetical protein